MQRIKTYTLTQQQLDAIKGAAVKRAVEKSFFLMLAVPLEVLIREDYWMNEAKEKMPGFIDDVLEVYKAYENGDISIEEMESDLLKYAGIQCKSQ